MSHRILSLVSFLALSIAVPMNAAAQQGANIDLQTFRPAMDSRGYITLNASQVLGHKELSFGLVTNWGRGILRFEDGDTTYEVENIISPTLVGAFGLRLGGLELELGMTMPFTIMSGDRNPDSDNNTPGNPNDDQNYNFEGQGSGDLGIHAKIRVLNTSRAPVGLAIIGSAFLPTASEDDSWLGDDSVSVQAMVAIDKELGRVKLVANGGFRYRKSSSFRDDSGMTIDGMDVPITSGSISVGSALPFGVGVAFAIVPQKFEVIGELFGAVPLEGDNYFPLEAIGGLKFYLARNSFLSFGAGTGVLPGGGNPDFRAFMGIVFEPNIGDRDGDGIKDDLDMCPDDPEDFDNFEDQDGCPDLDNDRDGIPDVDDQCPMRPEDKDGFEDEDGCPESNPTDRDNDGIKDDVDECPDDPEDKDDFEDHDGCPDFDNDNDMILDVDDLCPNDPEDKDDFEDEDGCPDPDNDGDLILDVDDACPNEPETYNAIDDEDGCPDGKGDVIVDGTIVTLQPIFFQFNSAIIKKQSFPTLDAVAMTLRTNPDITLIEVQGHTDERGSDEYNRVLSQARSESVMTYLADKGIKDSRLSAHGYGESVPLDTRHNEKAWAENRRVEFIILKRIGD